MGNTCSLEALLSNIVFCFPVACCIFLRKHFMGEKPPELGERAWKLEVML